VVIDNTVELPFSDDTFDAVVMRRGLCACRDGKVCGGIPLELPAATSFLRSVARVLNTQNPEAIAVLQGEIHHGFDGGSHAMKFWEQAVRPVVQELGLRAELVTVRAPERSAGYFDALVLRPAVGVRPQGQFRR
jgi:hypothetical protein